MFQSLGSNPANMESGKAADCYGCMAGHDTEQADAEQAYAQADLEGAQTWVALPIEAWPGAWLDCRHGSERRPKYQRPAVLLKKALYGHPDSGTYWEKHCKRAVGKAGFQPINNWPSCFFHSKLKPLSLIHI